MANKFYEVRDMARGKTPRPVKPTKALKKKVAAAKRASRKAK
jgi:hypothetical protein